MALDMHKTAPQVREMTLRLRDSHDARQTRLDRAVLATIRLCVLGVILFLLLQPSLVVSTAVPQENFVGILIDDSRSMALENEDGTPRSAFIAEAFTPDESELFSALSDRFVLRFFRFSDVASRIDGLDELTFDGTHTDIARALDVAREELAGVPLSGLIVISDGADNEDRPLAEALVPLQAAGAPVFTIGVGEESIEPDIEIGRVELPRAVLEGSTLMVDIVVTQNGFGRRTVPVIVESDLRILAEETSELGPAGVRAPVKPLPASVAVGPGPHGSR